MIRSLLISALFLFCFSLIWAQSEENAPILVKATPAFTEICMGFTKPSPRQIDTLLHVSFKYLFVNQDTSLMLAERAAAFSHELYANEKIHAKTLLQLGDAQRVHGQMEKGEVSLKAGKAIYQALGMEANVARANTKLGALCAEKGAYEQAIAYHMEVLETLEALADSQQLFQPYINISQVFYLLDRLPKARAYNLKALEIAELLDLSGVKMIALGNEGIFQKETADKFEALGDSLPEMRSMYQDSAEIAFQKAYSSYEQSLSIARESGNKRRIIELLGNMIDLTSTLGQTEASIQHGIEAATIAEELGSTGLMVRNQYLLARAYQASGQAKLTVQTGEEALQLAIQEEMKREQSLIQDVLYAAYKDLGAYRKALENFEAHEAYIKEVEAGEQNKAVAEIEEKYQAAQNEKQILELETENAEIARQRNLLFGGSLLVGVLGLMGFQLKKSWRERNDKIAFAKALIFAQEEERKRIARDLHDGIGQSLLLIKKQMETTQETSIENQQMISQTLEEVRSISRDLHPFQLSKFGLTAALRDMLEKVERSANLFISTELDSVDNLLTEEAEINVFRTLQEALSNIVKHAEATAAKVSIRKQGSELHLEIQDNGKGFDHELAVVTRKSLGLRTMHERISAIGGKLAIENGVSGGTKILFSIPLNAENMISPETKVLTSAISS